MTMIACNNQHPPSSLPLGVLRGADGTGANPPGTITTSKNDENEEKKIRNEPIYKFDCNRLNACKNPASAMDAVQNLLWKGQKQ